MNELPFRHLLFKPDGGITGTKTFAVQIGARLMGCENLHFALFKPVSVSWTSEMHNLKI